MSYQVLARKWRPRTFGQMVGQEHVLRAMINALDQGRLHHAYLFTGTRGVGKTTIARILAKSLNCDTGITSTPCGVCSACREIDEGRFVDLIEVDAASRTKVEDTRELLENVQYAPTRGRYKVYLIDEVHMLSGHSFNALLKTLEEPPLHVKFLLATTDPQKLPVTILSRCLQFSLKAMPAERIVGHLQKVLAAESVEFDESALWALARAAQGSMRDAMSLTDQAIAFGAGVVRDADVAAMLGTLDRHQAWRLLEPLASTDVQGLFAAFGALASHAPDYAGLLGDILQLLHRIATAQLYPEAVDNSEGDRDRVIDFAARVTPEDIQLFYQTGLIGRRDLGFAPDARCGFEMTLMRMLMFRPVPPDGAVRGPAQGRSRSTPVSAPSAARPESKATPRAESAPVQVQVAEPARAPALRQESEAATLSLNAAGLEVAKHQIAREVPIQQVAQASQSRASMALGAVPSAAGAAVASRPVSAEPASVRVDNIVELAGRRRDETSSAISAEHWHVLVDQLGLTGPALNFARNCALETGEGSPWVFVLSPGHQMLSQPQHVSKLEECLGRHTGSDLKIRIEVRDSAIESPAARLQRTRREVGEKAEAAFREDIFVRGLVQEFDAVIESHSIRPS